MKMYISHSIGCTGWDLDSLYKGTIVQKSCRTSRFNGENNIKMLDWDYRSWLKSPEKIEEKHLEIAKNYKLDIIMSMDLWDNNKEKCLSYTDKLLKYCNHVLIPVHFYCKELFNYELAYPNANWFSKNDQIPNEYLELFKHLLGGSPHSQLRLIKMKQKTLDGETFQMKNLTSVDGNQIFNLSVKGKYWNPRSPFWRKPKYTINNYDIFKLSLKHYIDELLLV